MIGRSLEVLFNRAYAIIKLNLMFFAFSFLGLLVLGIGPSLKVVNELYFSEGFEYRQMTWKVFFERFKANFVSGNLMFYSFVLLFGLLGYSLFFSVQIKGLLFIVIDFILFFALLFTVVTFQYCLIFSSRYEMNFKELLKLAVISVFSDFGSVLKLILGMAVIAFITYKYKGLLLFASFSSLQIWCVFATKKWLAKVDEKLDEGETEI